MLKVECSDIFTVNHYYMDTVNKIKSGLSAVESDYRFVVGLKGWGRNLLTIFRNPKNITVNDQNVDLSELVGISNDEQAAIDMQINLFAYWKVLHKRICDIVPMIIR